MTIFSIYILSKSGGLIYQLDHNVPLIENERTFSYPLEVTLKVKNNHVTVVYGQNDGIKGMYHPDWRALHPLLLLDVLSDIL